jgi:uncharacterized protein YegL
MQGAPIAALNAGLKAFQQDLQEDGLARRRVEIAIVTFGNGGVQKIQDFVTAEDFDAPTLHEGGLTPMGEAIHLGLDLLRDRKATYKNNGIVHYRPWVFMITDGAPTDEERLSTAAQRVQTEMGRKGCEFFAVGVAGANMEVLSGITSRALKLDGLKFRELFQWLSASQKGVASSKVGDQVPMPKVDFGSPINP